MERRFRPARIGAGITGRDDEMPTHCTEERRGSLADVGETIGEWVAVEKLVSDGKKTIATTLGTAILDSLSACLRFSLRLIFLYLLTF